MLLSAQSLALDALPTSAREMRTWHLPAVGNPLAVAEAAERSNGLTLVATASARQAAELVAGLTLFAPELPIFEFPDWETLPYDLFSPHQDIVSQRLRTLAQLPSVTRGILVVSVPTLMQRIAPREFVAARTFCYRTGDTLDREALVELLQQAGYQRVDTVYEHGEYAIRGSLIDIFPMGVEAPFRLDLLDDEIDDIRSFDPETQRTLDNHDTLNILPAKEFPLDKDGIHGFQNRWYDHFDDPKGVQLYKDVGSGYAPQGIEYYLPLFFDTCETLLDYCPAELLLLTIGEIEPAAQQFWQDLNYRYEEYGVDPERPILKPKTLFMPVDELFAQFKNQRRVQLSDAPLEQPRAGHISLGLSVLPDISVNAKLAKPLIRLQEHLESSTARHLFVVESLGRKEVLHEQLAKLAVVPQAVSSWAEFASGNAQYAIALSALEHGFQLADPALCVITETELYDQRIMQRRRRSRAGESTDQVIKDLTELRIGAPVVHLEHGIGRYNGLVTLKVDKADQEFLLLTYADSAKLYVPVSNLNMISRYSGSDEAVAPLHRLGSEQWQKAREKAAQKVRDTAVELLDIYARRAAKQGFACSVEEDQYQRFASDFPFEPTPDQADAIDAVRNDLLKPQPMDRLVCGDVGFGKTEVAMHAAFVAVQSGKQVLVLVPTTLLAQQHYQNFLDRFADWPVTIEVLSRFRTAKEQEAVLKKAEDGKVDILIGTHKLLHANILYKNLGLLIIDEEHRFGVRQKDAIKSLRSEVDILALTATPIPRTLNLSMHGVRDLSIIATPPAKRLSVKTFVRQQENRIVREAVLREILRGGQVYYLHNEVKTIAKAAAELRELVPEARIEVAHGQMRERELEKVMSDFYHQRFNVLICTTIIETGIDIPSANTIIIERADKFGLAQLHQLRGRVGRSHHQAYAYLMTPHPKTMTTDAVKRLEAIQAADHLGSGFTLATHDLEIRGAGELLGEEQSGHIQQIGFALYIEMLDAAVKALQSGKKFDPDASLKGGIDINLNLPALIPDDYLPDINARLTQYKRIASAKSPEALKDLQVEMIDRFGLLPEPTKNLFRLSELRLRLEPLGITKLEAGPNGGSMQFSRETTVEPITIINMIQQQPNLYRLQGSDKLRFTLPLETHEQRFGLLNQLIDQLTPATQPQGH